MIRYGLCDDQFARVENSCCRVVRDTLGATANSAINFRRRRDLEIPDGCSLARHADARFGYWKNIHTRFSRWAIKGVWQSLFKTLADDPDNEYAMIDATIVRAHQHSAGARKKKGVNQSIGRSRGGLTTKIHMIVDALGNPLAFTPGPQAKSTISPKLKR